MRDYVITVNSTVDLPKEWLKERHVPAVPLRYTIDGTTYTDMEGLSAKEFFAKLQDVRDVAGEPRRSGRGAGALCERRKGYPASWIFFRTERDP